MDSQILIAKIYKLESEIVFLHEKLNNLNEILITHIEEEEMYNKEMKKGIKYIKDVVSEHL